MEWRPLVHRAMDEEAMCNTVADWIVSAIPQAWRDASGSGRSAIRKVRSHAEYERWYPSFANTGLAVATWPWEYVGADLSRDQARLVEELLAPYNLGRLNPLGLNSAAPALFAHGSAEQRARFLPGLVRNEEKWCQLLSEPGSGSDLASLSTAAIRDGDEWVLTGQKVWTTWAHFSDFAVCLARTDPHVEKRAGMTYFIVDLHAPGVTIRPLRHLGGEVDFNEVFLDCVRVPDFNRIGGVGDGWRVARSTLAGERQMVAGAGSGGVDRIGGAGATRLLARARELHRAADVDVRQRLVGVYSEERIREWTNLRVRGAVAAGGTPGAAASIGKVHQGGLNQRAQMLASDLLSVHAMAWEVGVHGGDLGSSAVAPESYAAALPFEVSGMLRSRANTIEGGPTEINKTILAERVLGLPREPDPFDGVAWNQVPRS